MQVQWIKCQGDNWCSFEKLNLSGVTAAGIYVIWKSGSDNKVVYVVIWKSGSDNKVVYVGQGDVADRIADHRREPTITRHGPMNVTWAAVSQQYRDGIERYLANEYSPLEGDHHPNVTPIAVNLPGK